MRNRGGKPCGPGPSDEHRVLLSLEGCFLEVSSGFCEMVGQEANKLLGKRIDVVTPKDRLNAPKHLGAIFHFGHCEGLWMFVGPEGRQIVVHYTAEILPNLSIEMRGKPTREESWQGTPWAHGR
ncbi:MAG: hypothetical protein ACHQIK_10650 [Candidatus Acidiferrales bacterium]